MNGGIRMEKLELNLTRFEDIKGGNNKKAMQYLKALKQKKQLESYIDEMKPQIVEMVKGMSDSKAQTPAGTLTYKPAYDQIRYDNDKLEELVDKNILKECEKVIHYNESVTSSFKVA